MIRQILLYRFQPESDRVAEHLAAIRACAGNTPGLVELDVTQEGAVPPAGPPEGKT